MYSPKIKEDLIPILYRFAKHEDKSMTRIVDEILRPAIIQYEVQNAIPYCISCYTQLEIEGTTRKVTAYCTQCKSDTFVLYTLPIETKSA